MSQPPDLAGQHADYARLMARLAGVIDTINAGSANLQGLTRLLTVGQESLGAAGMAFAEYRLPGRVIAATGAAEWARGRPLELTDSALTELRVGPRVQDLSLDRLPARLARQLSGRGLMRVLRCRAELGPHAIGHVHAYFREAQGWASPEQRAVIQLVAACAAHQYADSDRPATHPDRSSGDLFVAVTSHELRTPVTVIKGYADTLFNHWASLGELDRREMLRAISQRSAELAKLVDRLLSATGASGVGGQRPTPFDLADGLRAALKELPAMPHRRLVIELPVDLPKALGDPASLTTVLTELITNADKYTDDNAAPVELTAGSDEQSVFFRVSDRGVGVRPEHVERAFDRFWQGESGNRRRYPGTGLGLYLVRRIVERQNGWVSLRPREGGGTVAEVRLPRGDMMMLAGGA